LLWAVLDSVTAIGCVLAIPGATTVGTVVHAVVTLFALIDDTVAAMDSTVHVAVALDFTVVDAVVTLFAPVKYAIATGNQRNPTFAVLHA
jgi:hypothetical protein